MTKQWHNVDVLLLLLVLLVRQISCSDVWVTG